MAKESIKSASISADKTSPEKERALSAALAQIERQFGKGSMMRLGDKELVKIPSISTGSLGLDVALGIGGLPQGRVVEIYGPESSGKTTLTLQVIAEAQKPAAPVHSSMPSTRWTQCMLRLWASIQTICWFLSQTPESKRWKSATCWFAPRQ